MTFAKKNFSSFKKKAREKLDCVAEYFPNGNFDSHNKLVRAIGLHLPKLFSTKFLRRKLYAFPFARDAPDSYK